MLLFRSKIAMTAPQKVRVRFAPSPTGYLHVGGARTALYNFLFAKHSGGDFILRVEDTDLERSTEESMKMQIADLKWLDIPWVEGPNPETFADMGPVGPYRQSRRKDIYMEHAQRLIAEGKAYYDFRSDAELDALKAAALAASPDKQYQVEAPAQLVAPDEAKKRIAAGEKSAIRFRVKEKRDFVLHDLVRGDVTFPSDMVGDFVCIRSNGMPVYNFCCVIDDALMKMTHVFRAEEHLPNTLRQMMLYEAFGYETPKFGHLSFILGPDRQKLSKRHGATSCNDYRLKGYLPEALNNFMLLSGWSSPNANQEIMTREEQIAQFTSDRFIASPAVFDTVKLEWMNSMYLRALPHEELWRRVKPFLDEAGIEIPASSNAEWRDQALSTFKVKMTTLLDAVALFTPLADSKFEMKPDAAEALGWPETRKVLTAWKSELEKVPGDRLTEQQFDQAQEAVKVAAGVKGKNLFMPIRVAVVGQPHGSELKMVVPLLAKSSLLKRVDQAIGALTS
jgi:nondiscriminating glutamyl-tRNA synthetase